MTDTSHRVYAVVTALVVFFVSWAAVAAKPWATAKPDPRLAVLAQREAQLRADARLVQRVVARRNVAYRTALSARRAQIAAVQARALQVAQTVAAAPAVRVVNLPPLTVTRTS
jgi:hypothetical protein